MSRLVVNHEALVKWFLDHGADPNLHGARNLSPLDTAAYSSTIAVIALLLEHGAKLQNSNALHAATRRPNGIPMMAYLLDRGFDINAIEHQYSPEYFERMKVHGFGTALHSAVRKGKKDRIQFLLDRGADREIRSTGGKTPAQWAKRYQLDDCFEILNGSPDSV